MNILVDARPLVDPKSGGVRRLVIGLTRVLLQAFPEHHFILVTTGLHELPLPFALPANAHRLHRKAPNKLINLAIVLRLTSLDRLFSESHAERMLITNVGFIGRPRIPYSMLVHDVSFWIERRWFSQKGRAWHWFVAAKRSFINAQTLFAVSECTQRDVRFRLKREATIMPMGFDPLTMDNFEIKQPNSRYALTMGYGDNRKNTECAELAAQSLGLKLINVGGNFRPNDDELSNLMHEAACFLYPSWYEGFGIPLHEAARYSTPCIASTAGALPDTAPVGTLFADPAKPQHWVEAVNRVLAQPEAHRTRSDLKSWEDLQPHIRACFSSFLVDKTRAF